jgi:hypothetical protein
MRRWAVVLSAVSISLGAATTVAGTANAGNDNDPYTLSGGNAQAGPMGGVVPAKGARPGGPKQSPNLTWHGQRVQTSTSSVQPIFWGGSWTSGSEVVQGLYGFYDHVGGSPYMGTNSEYTTDGTTTGAHVSTGVTRIKRDVIDTSAAPSRAPSTTTVLNEVVKTIGADNLLGGAYYPVYIDQPRGHAGYCAWHSYGTVATTTGSVQIQFGFFFNLNNDPGCDVDVLYGHSVNLAALGNVSGHELSEMATDPTLGAWLDSQGAENADKCAWTFSGQPVLLGSESWQIQGNWSNATYNNHKSGYANGGCIDGN